MGAGFAEGEIREAVGAGGGFEAGPVGVVDGGIPGEGLEFGLPGEGGVDEGAEEGAVEVSMGGVEGGDGVEDLQGTEDGDLEALDLLAGEAGGSFGGVVLFAKPEVAVEGEGEEDPGDEDTGDPERGAREAA